MSTFFYKGRFIFIPLGIAAFLSLTGFVVMSLWNYLLPAILHVGTITFWQAIGIFILCKILFGFGGGGPKGGAPWMRRRMGGRFKNMTPEEKEKFKEKMMQKCGYGRWGDSHSWDSYNAGTEKTTE